MSILFVFVDGVGLAPAGPDNPLSTLPTPALAAVLGGALTLERVQRRPLVALVPLDATLGVPGLPQSATGQTALLTGVNGAALLGFHATAYPGPRLRAVIAEHGLLGLAVAAGRRVAFANPYTPGTVAQLRSGERRASATTSAALAAGLPLRGVDELLAGRAVTWDVCRDHFAERLGRSLPTVSPAEAGLHLAALAADHDLTLYETFYTDLAAHGRFGLRVEDAVARLDGLLGGALAALPPAATLVLSSDHGNLEDATQRLHTRNPVPLLAVGPVAPAFSGLTSILDVTPAILAAL